MFVQLIDRRCSFNDDINTQDLETISPTSHHWLHPCHVDDITIIQILFFLYSQRLHGFFGGPKGSPIYLCCLKAAYIFINSGINSKYNLLV